MLRGSSADENKHAEIKSAKTAPRDDIAAKLAEKPVSTPAQTAQANKPRVLDEAPSTRSAFAAPPPPSSTMSGAQAVLPATSFNSRWSAFR